MNEESLNPRDRDWPDSSSECGQVLQEQFFECDSGPKRVALLERNGRYFLSLQKCYVEDGEVRFGGATWLRVEDGTAGRALQLAQQMLLEMLQQQLRDGKEEKAD